MIEEETEEVMAFAVAVAKIVYTCNNEDNTVIPKAYMELRTSPFISVSNKI